ncbi:type VI secretion system protein ImpB [Biostraticola tofi]|uniref:Type VI secretion system protein ImpB n=2 Tax=Biostraticola tofi TaxID=466109 RepID=A0A4V2W586_9GAMM|nr:type VI secretion system protein ImpB [Biostraticola tofi]
MGIRYRLYNHKEKGMSQQSDKSGQKFIARNRAPRVQIEYDVELYGAQRKVQLPFVMGVLADLVGKKGEPSLPAIDERKFMDVDTDNFNELMKSLQPGIAFKVENTLAGEGQLSVELSLNHIDDFLPDAIAQQIPALKTLLDARIELSNLLSYMDGKNGAENLIASLLQNRALLELLSRADAIDAADAASLAQQESDHAGR